MLEDLRGLVQKACPTCHEGLDYQMSQPRTCPTCGGEKFIWVKPGPEPAPETQVGDECPNCHKGQVVYNSILQTCLECFGTAKVLSLEERAKHQGAPSSSDAYALEVFNRNAGRPVPKGVHLRTGIKEAVQGKLEPDPEPEDTPAEEAEPEVGDPCPICHEGKAMVDGALQTCVECLGTTRVLDADEKTWLQAEHIAGIPGIPEDIKKSDKYAVESFNQEVGPQDPEGLHQQELRYLQGKGVKISSEALSRDIPVPEYTPTEASDLSVAVGDQCPNCHDGQDLYGDGAQGKCGACMGTARVLDPAEKARLQAESILELPGAPREIQEADTGVVETFNRTIGQHDQEALQEESLKYLQGKGVNISAKTLERNIPLPSETGELTPAQKKLQKELDLYEARKARYGELYRYMTEEQMLEDERALGIR